LRAAWSIFPLSRKNMEKVAAVRSWWAALAFGIALSNGRGHQRTDGALRLVLGSFPVKTIALAFITEDFLGVLIVLGGIVFLLRRHQLPANVNCRYFIPANSPVQNFSLARDGIEIPQITFIQERDGRRPVVCTDVHDGGSIRFSHEAMHLLIPTREIGVAFGV